jgi:hypothetical protein
VHLGLRGEVLLIVHACRFDSPAPTLHATSSAHRLIARPFHLPREHAAVASLGESLVELQQPPEDRASRGSTKSVTRHDLITSWLHRFSESILQESSSMCM